LSGGSPEYGLDHEARITGKVPTKAPLSPGHALTIMEADFQVEARRIYEQRLAMGVAREQARKDLPLSNFTESVWKIDIHNLFHFLALRMASDAQLEVRQYATIIGREIIAKLFPIAWQAFDDYVLQAMTLSRLDIEAIREVQAGGTGGTVFTNGRERDECFAKLRRLGIIT
jgi:thymidylate synthase (FAD)